MTKIPTDRLNAYYRMHRRENFAASQRLEGIISSVTTRDDKTPLPTKEDLRKKYAAKRA